MLPITIEEDLNTSYFIFEIYNNICVQSFEHSQDIVNKIQEWKITPDSLQIKTKSTSSENKKVSDNITNTIQQSILQISDDIINQYNVKYPWDFAIGQVRSGRNNLKVNDEVSYALYVDILCNTENLMSSEEVKNNLNKFKIRIANHISGQERKALTTNCIKLYHQQVVDLDLPIYSKRFENVISTYSTFLQELSKPKNYTAQLSDIPQNILKPLLDIRVQGKFE